jgi:tRNA pseudouridine38-40 synthase
VRTVQGTVEEALAEISGERVVVHGASRTDAGVHAEGQVASARFETRLAAPTLAKALDAKLPADVGVVAVDPAPDSFHARRDAVGKLYRYAIWNGRRRSPLRRTRFAPVQQPLDVAAMRAAAASLAGRHDYSSFQNSAAEWRAEGVRRDRARSAVRTLHRLTIRGEAGGELQLDVVGDGFLRGMVRTLVGTLVQVGQGRRAAESIPGLLAAQDRRLAGPTAPAAGLCLVRVAYDPDELREIAGL